MRDYVALIRQIEGVYPSAAGGTSRDEPLRASLVPYFNTLLKEIEREQRWSGSYIQTPIVTVSGAARYPMPTGMLTIERVFRVESNRDVVTLELYDPQELRRVYGEGAFVVPGPPVKYAFVPTDLVGDPSGGGTMIEFYPTPNGVYTIFVEGHQALVPIGETSGTTTIASTVLTVPSTVYLTNIGIVTTGTYLSIRGAGDLGVGGVADTHLTTWVNFASATTITLGTATPTAVPALGAQCFFNSVNWLLTSFDKVVLFGVLRMVASYLRDDAGYVMWEQRYQHELDLMRGYEFDRARTQELLAVGVSGQRQSELRRADQVTGYDIRGG